jgi:hypothetical protein
MPDDPLRVIDEEELEEQTIEHGLYLIAMAIEHLADVFETATSHGINGTPADVALVQAVNRLTKEIADHG